MKSRTHKSVRTGGKASLIKRKSTLKETERKKQLKLQTANGNSILHLVPAMKTKMSKRRRKSPGDDNDASSPETSSAENVSFASSSTTTVESSFHSPPVSRVPLVIDSLVKSCGQPLFSQTNLTFEIQDVEVPRPCLIKVRQRKRKRCSSISFEEVETKQDNIQVFPVRQWGLLIVVLPHPTTINFLGAALLQVISGSVKILGYIVEPNNGTVPVFSSQKVMCLDITTKDADAVCRQASRLQIVKDALLNNRVPENTVYKILDACDNSSVIVGFRKVFKFSDVHFASSLLYNTFLLKVKKNDFRAKDFKDFGFKIYLEASSSLQYPECEDFVQDVISSIKASDEQGTHAPRIIVQGEKGLGKSTFLRYTINCVLNEFGSIYYLDGDVGQSEFTPAGCVSLVKVTAPLTGPPFTHQTTPEKMYFLGATFVQEASNKYSRCVQLLVDYYKQNCSASPLFVNTMGWVTGFGFELLEEIKSHVLPTHVVKIVNDQLRSCSSRPDTSVESVHSDAKEFTYHRFAPADDNRQMNAAERRDLSILAYLGKCQKPYSSVHSLLSITPYCVYWKDMALYIGNQMHPDEHILYSLAGTWVALLCVDESLIMECDDPDLPKLISVEPFTQDCLGFGVIRSLDIVKKAFNVITPVPEDRLKKVNAIVKGMVMLPEALHISQDVTKGSPYVTEVIGKRSFFAKRVGPRKFRLKPKTEDQ